MRSSLHRYLVVTLAFLWWTLPALAEEANLNATTWMQTSAEYRAICYQTYRAAAGALAGKIRLYDFRRGEDGKLYFDEYYQTAVAYGSIRRISKPVAVVMDLDETVIDNGPYQNYLIKANTHFTPDSFAAWLEYQGNTPEAQRAIPGAVEFIKAMEARGVTVVYISNRDEKDLEATLETLQGLGVNAQNLAERVYLQKPKEAEKKGAQTLARALGAGDDSPEGRFLLDNRGKKARRQLEVMSRYHVLAWFGDNLFDFPVYVSAGNAPGAEMLQARNKAVSNHADRWGADWFILPNPMYGSWASSKTLPRGKWTEVLDDAGFGAFLESRTAAPAR